MNRLKNKKRSFKLILQFLILTLVVGYFATSIVQSTFASNLDKKPNVLMTINGNGSITQEGSLFGDNLLYPSTVEDAEKGVGGISGIIRIANEYGNVDIHSIGLGIKKEEMIINNNYPMDMVYDSFLNNIKIKIEKGVLFLFDRTLTDYTSLKNIIYDLSNNVDRGLVLNPKLSISKGQTIDLKYTLHMVEKAENELESVTAAMPIYINIHGDNIKDDDNGHKTPPIKDKEEIITSIIPLPSQKPHWAHDCIITLLNHGVIVGFPHEEMTIEDYKNGTVDPAVYVKESVQPDRYITRAEAAVIVGRALGLKEEKSIITGYIDPIPSWARGHIIATTKKDIFKGYPGRLFKPNKYITREEMIAVLTRAYEIYLEDKGLELGFKDKEEIGEWALESVKAGYEKKVIQGYPDNTYRPKNNITRGETFTIICRLMGLHEEHTKE